MRKPRLEHPGALYYVVARGNRGQKIFTKEGDYQRYLELLGERRAGCPFTIYAYCLVKDQVHLLIEQNSGTCLSRYMQRLQSAYSNYYNRRSVAPGHVFRGRYQAVIVDKERYLAELVRVIHRVPLRSNRPLPDPYPWSSHGQYLGIVSGPEPLVARKAVTDQIVERHGVRDYTAFMNAEVIPEGWMRRVQKGVRVLGDRSFEEETHRKANDGATLPRKRIDISIGQIWSEVLRKRNQGNEPMGWIRSRLMAEAAFVAVEAAGWKRKEIAEYFKVGSTTISKAVKRMEKKWDGKDQDRSELLQLAGER